MVSDDIKMPVADTSDTFILENGGSSIKAGFSSQSTPRNHTESQIKFNPQGVDSYCCGWGGGVLNTSWGLKKPWSP